MIWSLVNAPTTYLNMVRKPYSQMEVTLSCNKWWQRQNGEFVWTELVLSRLLFYLYSFVYLLIYRVLFGADLFSRPTNNPLSGLCEYLCALSLVVIKIIKSFIFIGFGRPLVIQWNITHASGLLKLKNLQSLFNNEDKGSNNFQNYPQCTLKALARAQKGPFRPP